MNTRPIWPTHSFRAMGCQINVWLESELKIATPLFADVEALFAQNERVLSRFLPESELSKVNGRSGEWVIVSDLLWAVLCEALTFAEMSDGLFDPTMLRAVEAAGYDRSFEQIAIASAQIYPASEATLYGRWSEIRLDEARQAVWLPPWCGIDLGGIAKGFAAQQAVQLLDSAGPCLVDAGGDLSAGRPPVNLPGWPVAIAAPGHHTGESVPDLLTLWLAKQSLATSGTDYRRWQQVGHLAHHIMHPLTGRPAFTDALTVSALADTAVAADVWATTALISGVEAGLARLRSLGLFGLIVAQNGAVYLTDEKENYYDINNNTIIKK